MQPWRPLVEGRVDELPGGAAQAGTAASMTRGRADSGRHGESGNQRGPAQLGEPIFEVRGPQLESRLERGQFRDPRRQRRWRERWFERGQFATLGTLFAGRGRAGCGGTRSGVGLSAGSLGNGSGGNGSGGNGSGGTRVGGCLAR